ncbi:MAG: peptidoglycan DD-metalloendopeptidase family protein [Candidatus Thiodiazotropha sp. (ex Ustalcina ferruginea)]|nr:peptidoglycan DD-metalloendopeptidase family protein [Candidatus Thiodiazotropha sp. (ex Ustalcina ferruginea)]
MAIGDCIFTFICFSQIARGLGIVNLLARSRRQMIMLGPIGLMLLLSLLTNTTACSSKGSAPVYTRSTTETSRTSSGTRRNSPAQPLRRKTSLTYYLVQAGDTLYSIAWRYNLSHELVAVWNGIKGPEYPIYPGQRLRLKPPATRQKRLPNHSLKTQPVPQKKRVVPRQKQLSRTTPAAPQSQMRKKPTKKAATLKSPQQRKLKKGIKLKWVWPTKGRVVQTFSGSDQNRKGIRIRGDMGQPIAAAEAGKVVYAGGGLVGYGNLIIIKHDQEFLSAYGYNRKLLVKEGDKLAKGDIVAHMGSPNREGQPMLHFEVRKQGKPINPLPLLPRR